MARQQQVNIRRRSIVSYVGITEHGPCGYCKSTKRAHDKANFADDTAENAFLPSSVVENSSTNGETSASTVASSSSSGTATKAGTAEHLHYDHVDGVVQNDDHGGDEGNSAVFGLWAHQLTVPHYQCLADRGWRRSGRYLYKPLMDRTCCPQYTIRLDVHKFRLSRTQKRVLRAVRDFLRNDHRPNQQRAAKEGEGDRGGTHRRKRRRRGSSAAGQPTTTTTVANWQQQRQQQDTTTKSKNSEAHGMERQPKKKEMRRRRAEERLRARSVDLAEYKRQRAAREAARRRTVQSFLEGYNGPGWAHAFELRLIGQPSTELDDDLDEEFELFRRYQMQIHRERETDVTLEGFQRFLDSSPLFAGPRTAAGGGHAPETDNQQQMNGLPPCPPFGSFHQQYRLDGCLIAVAVIDLLPHCLSSKYFFYDPDYAFLSLGTYSALREIAFTQLLAQHRPDLHFYYMGFYLYDCPKMRYKGRFRPSELLCDHCLNWVPFSECDRIIEANGGRFSTFHPSGEPARAQLDSAQIDQIVCLFGDPPQPRTFGSIRHSLSAGAASSPDNGHLVTTDAALLLDQLRDKVHTFAYHAGPAALEMVLFLQ